MLALFDGEPRPDSAADLGARGWSTTTRAPADFLRSFDRGPRPDSDTASDRWVFAAKP